MRWKGAGQREGGRPGQAGLGSREGVALLLNSSLSSWSISFSLYSTTGTVTRLQSTQSCYPPLLQVTSSSRSRGLSLLPCCSAVGHHVGSINLEGVHIIGRDKVRALVCWLNVATADPLAARCSPLPQQDPNLPRPETHLGISTSQDFRRLSRGQLPKAQAARSGRPRLCGLASAHREGSQHERASSSSWWCRVGRGRGWREFGESRGRRG